MSVDNYITEHGLSEIRKEYGEKIVSFTQVYVELKRWYEKYDLDYPFSSTNNYRDSWFHYRKIWQERGYDELVRQTATLDEHLQRAEKDTVVKFMQYFSQWLEYWYLINDEKIPEEYLKEIQQDTEDVYAARMEGGLWLNTLWEKYSEEKKSAYALVYAAQKYVMSNFDMRKKIQKIIHLIKNATLAIRMDASDIHRIGKPGEYLKDCHQCYDQLTKLFDEGNGEILFLVEMTDVVRACIEYYKL